MLLPDTNEAAAEWDGFVASRPDSTFFHLSGWREVIKRSFGHACPYLVARDGGALSAVMPLTEINSRLFGHFLIGNGFCVGGGPLWITDAIEVTTISVPSEVCQARPWPAPQFATAWP